MNVVPADDGNPERRGWDEPAEAERGSGLDGVVVRAVSEHYDVQTSAGRWTCRLRERARRQALANVRDQIGSPSLLRRAPVVEPVVVGDRVRIELPDEANPAAPGWIVAVEPRRSALTRRASGERADVGQVLVANVDQIVVIVAAREPEARPGMIDRFLIAAWAEDLPAVLCVNKIDLGVGADLAPILPAYRRAGYDVLEVSARTGHGIDHLRAVLAGRISAVVGPSGVGKSTLLNTLLPGLGLKVGAISEAVAKGKHTTRYAQLVPLGGGGYCVDTPGLREFGLWRIDPEALAAAFPELAPHADRCRFRNCRHVNEPACAVREAVAAGAIDARRYESYVGLRLEGEAEAATRR